MFHFIVQMFQYFTQKYVKPYDKKMIISDGFNNISTLSLTKSHLCDITSLNHRQINAVLHQLINEKLDFLMDETFILIHLHTENFHVTLDVS